MSTDNSNNDTRDDPVRNYEILNGHLARLLTFLGRHEQLVKYGQNSALVKFFFNLIILQKILTRSSAIFIYRCNL